MKYSARGFTLIELMIVVVVIGIIAMFAYPAYLDYVRKGRRAEAQKVLMAGQISEERYRSYLNNYGDKASLAAENLALGTTDHYDFTIPTVSSVAYQIVATAKSGSPQEDDTGCVSMAVNSTNILSPASCWKR